MVRFLIAATIGFGSGLPDRPSDGQSCASELRWTIRSQSPEWVQPTGQAVGRDPLHLAARSAQDAANEFESDAERLPSDRTAEAANYRQYEPQNVPLPDDLPPQTEAALPPQNGPGTNPMGSAPSAAVQGGNPPWLIPASHSLTMTWTSGSGDDLGITDFDYRSTLIVPRVPGLMITPTFGAHMLNGPVSTDLPPALYDNALEIRWLRPLSQNWALDLAVTPSLFTDYENMTGDAVRIMGRALGLYTLSPQWQFAFGVVYLDRQDIRAVPGVGAIWTPNERSRYELIFPRPRAMYRISETDSVVRWLYLGGELGGGSWAIRRPPEIPSWMLPFVTLPPGSNATQETNDIVTYGALRLFVGYEAKRKNGFSPRIEAGWTFNREIEYESGRGNLDLPSAAMLRFGGSF